MIPGFSKSQLGNNEAAVRGALEHSPQVREIALRQLAFALRDPGPEVLDGGYRQNVYTILREFRVRFPMAGPDYLAFNLLPEDAYQVVSRTAPGFIAVIETARDRFAALSPPAELHDDHKLLVRYFEETVAAQRAVLNAAAAEDFGGLREGMGETNVVFCDTALGISDEMKPVVSVQFGEPPDDSGLPPEICGPRP